MNSRIFPAEVVATLDDLTRLEGLVTAGRILPSFPVYSVLAGRHHSKLRGRGLDFEEVRPYVPGDDIRNIDWRVTARTGVTHSKLFNEEKERPVFTVLDQSSWMFFGSRRFVKSVSAAHAAAISVHHTLKRGDRAGGIIFGEEGFDIFPPRRNKELVRYYLQAVVKWNGLLPQRKTIQSNTSVLKAMLKETAAVITHDHVITVISDFSMIDEETVRLLKGMSNHNDVVLVHIYDELEETLPEGRLVLTDGRQQITWDNRQHNRGDEYRQSFREIRRQLIGEFRPTRIPVVFFNTTDPMEDQISRELAKYSNRWMNYTGNS